MIIYCYQDQKFNTKPFEIRTHSDVVVGISDAVFGKGYITHSSLKERNDITSKTMRFCCVVEDEEQNVVGFCLFSILTQRDFREKLNVPFWRIPVSFLKCAKIGIIETVAVREDKRNLGLGSLLVEEAILNLISYELDIICSLAWENRDNVPLRGILEGFGMEQVAVYRRYWERDSLRKNYICIECGEPPCRCSAKLFAVKYEEVQI